MKRKVLVVVQEGKLREDMPSIMAVLRENKDIECFTSPHEKAFSAFDKINPEIIIVCDYADHPNAKGFQTYQNFSRYIAALKKTIIRIGIGAGVGDFMRGYMIYPSSFASVRSSKKIEHFCAELRSYIQP